MEEILAEGAKVIGWEKRNPVPGGNAGRFKGGFGLAMSQHHAGRVGYHEGEIGFERVLARTGGGGGGGGAGEAYNATLDLNARGEVILHYAQPDSGKASRRPTTQYSRIAVVDGSAAAISSDRIGGQRPSDGIRHRASRGSPRRRLGARGRVRTRPPSDPEGRHHHPRFEMTGLDLDPAMIARANTDGLTPGDH